MLLARTVASLSLSCLVTPTPLSKFSISSFLLPVLAPKLVLDSGRSSPPREAAREEEDGVGRPEVEATEAATELRADCSRSSLAALS